MAIKYDNNNCNNKLYNKTVEQASGWGVEWQCGLVVRFRLSTQNHKSVFSSQPCVDLSGKRTLCGVSRLWIVATHHKIDMKSKDRGFSWGNLRQTLADQNELFFPFYLQRSQQKCNSHPNMPVDYITNSTKFSGLRNSVGRSLLHVCLDGK